MTYANRGAKLEKLIDATNAQYRKDGIALIDKIPNAWVVRRSGPKIVSAFPSRKTGVDYIGIANNFGIAIEAKSTANETRFPLDMIQAHQLKFLEEFEKQGGLSYFIIGFSKLGEIYAAQFSYIDHWVQRAEQGGRKSIPYKDIAEYCERIEADGKYKLHYLKALM